MKMKGFRPSPVGTSSKDGKGRASRIPQRNVCFQTPPVRKSNNGTFLIDSDLPSISEENLINKDAEKESVKVDEEAKDTLDCDWLTTNSKQNDLLLVNDSTDSRMGNSHLLADSRIGNSPILADSIKGNFHLAAASKDSELRVLPAVNPVIAQMRHRQVTAPGGLDGSLGRLITEEDLLDTIFFSCDEKNTGKVAPSVLLEFVQMIMLSSHLDDTPDMEELAHILDPLDMDIPMDLQTYQRAMSKWIEEIQSNKPQKLINLSSEEEADPPPMDESPLPVTSTPMLPPSQKDKPWTSRRAFNQSMKGDNALPSPLDIPCFSYGSNNTNSVDISNRDREAEFVNQIEDLKFQVKKLTDQNAKLQLQMESTEENNTHLLIELDTVQTKLKSSEVVIQRSMSVREQNEELHTEVSNLEGCRSDIEKKYKAVVAERDVLQVKLKNLSEEIEQAYENIDEQKRAMDAMQELVSKLQKEYQEAEEKLAMQSVELAEKSMQFEEIQGQVKELLVTKETLKTEKDHLEDKVDELKQELTAACQVPPKDVKYMQTGDGESEMDCSTMMIPPVTCSTPYKQPTDLATSMSIYSELKAVSTSNNLPPVYGILPLDESYQSSLHNHPHDATIEIVAKLKKKKEAVLEQVKEIMKGNAEHNEPVSNTGLSKEVVTCINKEMDQILEQMKVVARSKHLSDERAKKLAKLLAEITDEKATLIRQHEEALGKIHQLNYDQQQLELIKTENEILEHSIEHEKSRLSLMDQRLKECQTELKESREREVKWKKMLLERQETSGRIHPVESTPVESGPHPVLSGHLSRLIEALSLEGLWLPSQPGLNEGSSLRYPRGGSTVSASFDSLGLAISDPKQKVSRNKSGEASFVTARDTTGLSSFTFDAYQSAAGGLSKLSTLSSFSGYLSPRKEFSQSLAGNSADGSGRDTSFCSVEGSLDRNNNCEALNGRGLNGKTNYTAREKSRDKSPSAPPPVKILCEVGVQTFSAPLPDFTAVGASRPKSDKLRRRSIPWLDLSRARNYTEVYTVSSPPSSPTSPTSPLLKVPRLARADSPFSLDSDHSQSSQFSFKTAPSSSPPRSPPQSPSAFKSFINTSREADVSSEGFSSQDSSFSPLSDLFQTCTEEDLAGLSGIGRMDQENVDVNFNKSENDGGESSSSGSSAFSPVAKTRAKFGRETSYSATTFDEDGSMIDLITAELLEEPLTEADKEMNAKLLNQSQEASERFWNRRGRKNSDRSSTEKSAVGAKAGGNQDGIPSEKRTPDRPRSKGTPTGQGLLRPKAESSPTKSSSTTTTGMGDSETLAPVDQSTVQNGGSPVKTSGELDEKESRHRRVGIFLPKMPELMEASETESGREAEESAPEADKRHSSDTEDAQDEKEETLSEEAPPPLKRKRSAILSDALLQSLGLMKGGKDPVKMTEHEVEMKFKDLSLALKSSQMTLEKRVEIQQRERDLAENNMGRELDNLLATMLKFPIPDSDSSFYHQATKLKQQVKMLQTFKTVLASKAEGLGQVLQEKRISTACEVMVKYVDNLRSMLEVKQGELEEAKKLIQDNRLLYRPSAAVAEEKTRRASSAVMSTKARRRASVAVTNTTVPQQDSRGRFHSFASSLRGSPSAGPHRQVQRTASTLSDFKPLQLADKSPLKPSVSFRESTSTPPPLAVSPLAQERKASSTAARPQTSSPSPLTENGPSTGAKDDESFKIGFEQGVHNQVSQELEDLREQQRLMVENLEELIDSMEEDEKEEVVTTKAHNFPQLSSLMVHPTAIPWVKVQKVARLTATFLLVLAACCSIVFTLMPAGSGRKVGAYVSESPLATIHDFFWPYTSLVHSETPPR